MIKMPKTLITFQNFKMSKSNKTLLDNVNVSINKLDRIILVGKNGCGKSSLLKILKNKEEYDAGYIWVAPNLKIDYLEQDPPKPNISNLFEFLSQDNKYSNLSMTKEIVENDRIQRYILVANKCAMRVNRPFVPNRQSVVSITVFIVCEGEILIG